MPDYKSMYIHLFGEVTRAIQAICDALPVSEVMRILSEAQQTTEGIYIDTYEEGTEEDENAEC